MGRRSFLIHSINILYYLAFAEGWCARIWCTTAFLPACLLISSVLQYTFFSFLYPTLKFIFYQIYLNISRGTIIIYYHYSTHLLIYMHNHYSLNGYQSHFFLTNDHTRLERKKIIPESVLYWQLLFISLWPCDIFWTT